jgi:hypothetical protein
LTRRRLRPPHTSGFFGELVEVRPEPPAKVLREVSENSSRELVERVDAARRKPASAENPSKLLG